MDKRGAKARPMKRTTVRSACCSCHGVCQVLVHLEGDRVVKVTGDPDSPTSRGYICPKGAAAPQLLYHPDRLTHPLRRKGPRGANQWERISWDEALDQMAGRFQEIRERHGAHYLALAQGTGRPYLNLAPRLANALGTPNFVAVGHICYAPRQAASRATLGQLPVTDIYGFGGETPACMVVWGCNITANGAADGMCGGMVTRALKQAGKVIVIDPRRTGPAARADHWLQIRPGSDGALALAMIHTMISEDLYDHEFVENYSIGFDRLREHVQDFTPEWAAGITRLEPAEIRAATRTYAAGAPSCVLWGNGLDMGPSNFQTARAVLILMGLSGNIDRPGGDVLWVPPVGVKQQSIFQDPAASGREFLPPGQADRAVNAGRFSVNALPVQPHVFWRSLISGDPYRVKALWLLGTNPLLTHTDSLQTETALRDHLEFTVASDFFLTPTAQLADLVLPAATWLETDDVANLHKIWCVLARRKVAQVGEVRENKEVMIQLAHRLGLSEAFPWRNFRQYLDWVLEDTGLDFEAFCDKGILTGQMQYHKHRTRGFATPSGKFEFCLQDPEALGAAPLPTYREPALSPLASPELLPEYPLILSAGRSSRFFFLSEGRQIASLRKRNPDPLLQINPQTADELGIADGDWVWIETPGDRRVKQRAQLFDGIRPDNVNAQFGWWYPEEAPPEYGWKKSSINLLFGQDGGYDPETGSESLHSYLCRVYRA